MRPRRPRRRARSRRTLQRPQFPWREPTFRRVAVGALALSLGVLAPSPARADAPVPWATRRAAELTASGERLAAAGAPDEALVAYRDAIAMDPTYGPAFLHLAAARETAGDPVEAERVLSMALERIPDYPEAREKRATLRERRGDGAGAVADLELAVDDRPSDLALHGRLVDACVRAGALPRALAAARRWAAAATTAGDDATRKRAAQTAAALTMVVDRADPVSSAEGRGDVRSLLGAWAKRQHQPATARPPKAR